VKDLSRGEAAKLALVIALSHRPKLLILDEPTTGLDPLVREEFLRAIVHLLPQEGRTVFFSTHILSDAEALCDRVGVLRAGRLIRAGALAELLSLDVQHVEVFVSGLGEGAPALAPARRRERVGERVRLEVDERDLGRTVAAVEAAGGRILSVQPVRQTLEDYFFREMGSPAGGGSAWGEG